MYKRSTHNRVKLISNMAWTNFDTWIHAPRTLLMFMFITIECFMLIRGLVQMQKIYFGGRALHLVEMLVYRMAAGCNLPVTSILMLVMVNELPRRIRVQHYMMMRSDKKYWLSGQILYLFMIVASMIAMVTLSMIIFALPYAEPGYGWSDIARINANESTWEEAILPTYLIKTFTPLQALFFCMIPLGLFWLLMMFIILLTGLLGSSLVGTLICAFILVAQVTFLFDGFSWARFPIEYGSYNGITMRCIGNEAIGLIRTFGGYAIAIGALLFLMFRRVRKIDFDFFLEL